MKLAPNTFDVIIDNSCYVTPPLKYIVGFEHDKYKPEIGSIGKNIITGLFTLTNWTFSNTKNTFHQGAYDIRNLLDKNQIQQMIAQGSKAKIISYHSKFDNTASFDEKQQYYETFKKNAIDFDLHSICSEDQVDGILIKSLQHAMGMSIKALIDAELPDILSSTINTHATDISLKSIIKYKINSQYEYTFKYMDRSLSASILFILNKV